MTFSSTQSAIIILILVVISSCVPPTEVNDLDINPDFDNDVHRTIWDLQDTRSTAELLPYFSSEVATERFLAALAFASIQDIAASEALFKVLNEDLSSQNRTAAAYALGQIGDPSLVPGLINSFAQQDTSEYNTLLRGAILEAIGKCGELAELKQIASVSTYQKTDDHLLLGQMRSIYRFGIRGIFDPSAIRVSVLYLGDKDYPAPLRQLAASYLQRSANEDLTNYREQLLGIFRSESDVYVQAAMASALGRMETTDGLLLSALKNISDYRVKCNGLRAMNVTSNTNLMDSIIYFIKDENVHVRHTAAELLGTLGIPNRATELLDIARAEESDLLKARLLASALNIVPPYYTNTRNVISDEIKKSLTNTNFAYRKIEYIKALTGDPTNYPEIKKYISDDEDPVVETTAILALGQLISNSAFSQLVRSSAALNAYRKSLVNDLIGVIESKDAGAIAAACSVVRNENLNSKEYIELRAPLRQASRDLNLPEETETKYEIESTLDFLNDTTTINATPAYNHPIDWTVLEGLSDSARAYITTTKGQIIVNLFMDQTPATVANFVKLSRDNFYDGKFVHRVVPNFVIQTGCPRGDGYGGLGYSIRTETPQLYYNAEGYIGMASAGKDTEGTQWFITHSPTPHLDGRYTIFGRVAEGMEVVHAIEPGDVIQDVRILKL